jgi:putative glutathione S-transferase
MKLMINGHWQGDVDPTPERDALRMIHSGNFRGGITADGSSGYSAEAGRYHLYVSPACPFSHRVIIVRALKRLESVVGLSILHPLWDTADGWAFADTGSSTVDRAGNGFLRLHEAYRASRPDYTGKVTVPVLWDQHSRRIVNNESLEIARMLNDAFDGIGSDRRINLSPASLRSAMADWNNRITRSLAVGVYSVADARDQQEYDTAMDDLFGFLDDLDLQLATAADFSSVNSRRSPMSWFIHRLCVSMPSTIHSSGRAAGGSSTIHVCRRWSGVSTISRASPKRSVTTTFSLTTTTAIGPSRVGVGSFRNFLP